MKKGFTMIELIFVIVILGILAAVAIPKLAATRDDAKIASALSEVSTALNDFGSYYTSQGAFRTPALMTNVKTWDSTSIDLNVTAGTTASIYYLTPDNGGANENCVRFTFTSDGNVTIDQNTTVTGNVCIGLRTSSAFNTLGGTKSFGGKRVSF